MTELSYAKGKMNEIVLAEETALEIARRLPPEIRKVFREELTSGDATTRKLLTELLLSVGVEKDIKQELSAESILGGGSKDVDIEIPTKRAGVAFTLKATYDPAATAGVRISIFYSQDGVNWDTDTDDIYDHPFGAGTSKQKTYILAAVPTYVRIRIENLDATYAVTIDLWRCFI